MKVRLSRALVVACAVLVLTGLWGSGTSGALVGRASAPDGYDTKKIKSAGLSLALPSTWLSLDPKSKRTKAIIDAAVAKNPNLKDVPAEFDAIKSQVAYWAVDADAADFAANVFVLPLALDKSIVKSPADVEAMFQAQAGSLASDVAAQPVRIGGVRAVQTDATVGLTKSDGTPIDAYVTIFWVPTKTGLVQIDYTAAVNRDTDRHLKRLRNSIRVL